MGLWDSFLLLVFFTLGWFLLNVLLYLLRISPRQMTMTFAAVLGFFTTIFYILFQKFL